VQQKLHEILKRFWGYDSFRKGQLEIIESVIENKYTLALLTTGGGKSICYQVAGLYLGGTTIVISPLISLMQDQVSKLKSLGIEAEVFNSLLSRSCKRAILERLHAGRLDFIYLSPESLQSSNLLSALRQVKVSLVTVDEAHCISMWGHDFRPAYTNIAYHLKQLENAPNIAAFTATATVAVRKDIIKQLRMKNPRHFIGSFRRENLAIRVNRGMRLCDYKEIFENRLKESPILVYSSTRSKTEKLTESFRKLGYDCSYYHGGLHKDKRAKVQQNFLKDKYQIVFATNAFGMGVDKPNIYTVVHETIPDSIENYYQEAGRAGRDGSDSLSVVNFSWEGVNTRQRMVENNYVDRNLINRIYNYLLTHVGEKQVSLKKQELLLQIEGINNQKLLKSLQLLNEAGLIKVYDISTELIRISVNNRVIFLGKHIDFAKQVDIYHNNKRKLAAIVNMLMSPKDCRMKSILKYFAENSDYCYKCDNCEKISNCC
jgi:ATP-dependent DNA helicase RecQ